MNVKLLCVKGSNKGKAWEVDHQGNFSIGREKTDAYIKIPCNNDMDRTISRMNTQICVFESFILVEDLKSKNGTYVDGKKISERIPVKNHSIVGMGKNGQAIILEVIFEENAMDKKTKRSSEIDLEEAYKKLDECLKKIGINN